MTSGSGHHSRGTIYRCSILEHLAQGHSAAYKRASTKVGDNLSSELNLDALTLLQLGLQRSYMSELPSVFNRDNAEPKSLQVEGTQLLEAPRMSGVPSVLLEHLVCHLVHLALSM